MKRVVVTGIGSVGPLGNSFGESWEAMKAGRSGIGQITRFDCSCLPWKIAGELRSFDCHAYLSPKEMKRLDPFVHYAVAAAVMALENGGLIEKSAVGSVQSAVMQKRDSSLFSDYLTSAGVIIGSSRGGINTIEKSLTLCRSPRPKAGTRCSRLSPYIMPSTTISMASSYVSQTLGLKGHCLGISNACASGTNAVGEAFRLIKSGYSRTILAGGTEAPICGLAVEGYGISGALSRRTAGSPRPFDRARDGFVLAEGACLLLLEEYEQAVKRGADIYGEIKGYGNSCDAFHMTQPDFRGESEAIRAALKEAGFGPEEIDYINAHATGTQLGDLAEARAIQEIFRRRTSPVPVSSTKSMTGHMLAASGPFEIAATLMSMKEGLIPATINLHEKDPECDINIVSKNKKSAISAAISSSFGFGGVNAVIVLKKY